MSRSFVRPGRLVVAALVVALAHAGAFAQTVFYGDDNPRGPMTNSVAARNAFQSALNSFGVDNIESYPAFTPSPTLTFGATGITATTTVAFVADFDGAGFNFAASGTKALFDAEGVNDSFTLSTPVNGFGMFLAQAGDSTNVNTISLLLENTSTNTSLTVPINTFGPGRSDDSIFFIGVITNDAFDRVSVIESFDHDGTLYDDVTVGFAAVPEPTTVALIGAALGGAGLVWWRRRRQVRNAA